MLSISNATVVIEGTTLLDEVCLDVAAGEIVALVGPNGAGKSTLVKTVAGEQTLRAGEIAFNGQPMSGWKSEMRARHMAVLPQKSVLDFPFTGREVVSLSRTPHNTGQRLDREIVDEVLGYLDATHLADRLYPRLSGGEQQRIQLARVLAQIWRPEDAENPRLLVLDEPSSSFDLAHQQLLIALARKLAERGVGVLIVLHDLNMALSCADRIAVLCCGQMRAFGAPNNVLNESLLRDVFGVTARFLTDPQSGQRFVGLLNETTITENQNK